jgi:hypothetical protein
MYKYRLFMQRSNPPAVDSTLDAQRAKSKLPLEMKKGRASGPFA